LANFRITVSGEICLLEVGLELDAAESVNPVRRGAAKAGAISNARDE
jgi:hypothetical protein